MPNARWIGPFDALTPGNAIVRVGDVVNVSDRDLESAHWQALDAPKTVVPAAAPTAKTSEGGDD